MSVELKACPFCNSDDIRAMETSVFWYRCVGCLAEGAAELTKYGAITAWNTRAYEPDQARISELEAEVERLREVVKTERNRCDRLTVKMIQAACKAHFRSENIEGVNVTSHGVDYTFRQAFCRMWNAACRARAALEKRHD